jgi:hypothetical protein
MYSAFIDDTMFSLERKNRHSNSNQSQNRNFISQVPHLFK